MERWLMLRSVRYLAIPLVFHGLWVGISRRCWGWGFRQGARGGKRKQKEWTGLTKLEEKAKRYVPPAEVRMSTQKRLMGWGHLTPPIA